MKDTWLLLDCPYLLWRSYYSTGALSHEGTPTGVLYGFFRSLISIQDSLSVSRIAFCFDGWGSKRKTMLPSYKENRGSGEDPNRLEVVKQMVDLREVYLHEIGYRNIFWKDGYEADDVIAAIINQHTDEMSQVIIVSSDKDLYQLLSEQVWMWNPITKKAMTEKLFREMYGLGPEHWAWVKSIAGCKTDNVPGIPGIGEKTALKYLLGKCPKAKIEKIKALGGEVLEQNRPLVRLPLPGVGKFDLQEDEISLKKWREFCTARGMSSLVRMTPVGRLPYD